MIFLTVADALEYIRPHVNSGSCNDALVLQKLNAATRRLMNHPKKPLHIRRTVRFWTDKDSITLPNEIGKILHYTMDGAPAPLFSQAYEFVSGGPGDTLCKGCIAGKYLEHLGDYYPTMFEIPNVACPDTSAGETGPQFSEVQLVAFSTEEADRGVELTIQGRGAQNEKLMTGTAPGVALPISVWDAGIEGSFTASEDSPTLSDPVRDIAYVKKPITAGHVNLYTFDPDTLRMYFLSKYAPGETIPRYRRYRITAPDYTNGSCILAWCELAYLPATHEDEILLIQNLDALKMMVMAMEMEDERNFEFAKAHEADAYRMIDNQRTADRTHDYNLIQVSKSYGYGDIRKA